MDSHKKGELALCNPVRVQNMPAVCLHNVCLSGAVCEARWHSSISIFTVESILLVELCLGVNNSNEVFLPLRTYSCYISLCTCTSPLPLHTCEEQQSKMKMQNIFLMLHLLGEEPKQPNYINIISHLSLIACVCASLQKVQRNDELEYFVLFFVNSVEFCRLCNLVANRLFKPTDTETPMKLHKQQLEELFVQQQARPLLH